jgi:hypothetical protein
MTYVVNVFDALGNVDPDLSDAYNAKEYGSDAAAHAAANDHYNLAVGHGDPAELFSIG